MNNYWEGFRGRVSALQKIHNMTEREFVNKAGVTISSIQHGKGDPQINVARKIKKNFGVDLDWLLDGDDDSLTEKQKNDLERVGYGKPFEEKNIGFILTDEQWEKIKDICPVKRGTISSAQWDSRLFIEAVLFKFKNKTVWREVPTYFGNWEVIYQRFKRLSLEGIFDEITSVLMEFKKDKDLIRTLKEMQEACNRWYS